MVILGAGVAGLAAAERLVARGRKVTILEARDRIGGRIWTLREPGLPVPIELGAEFLHGEAEETRDVARRQALGVVDVNGRRFAPRRGRLRRLHDFDARILGLMMRLQEDREPDRSVAEAVKRIRSLGSQDRALVMRFVEGYHAADPARISERSIAGGEDPREMRIARIDGGYDRIVYALASRVASRIRLEAPVSRVRWRAREVVVEYGPGSSIAARAIIVTAPLGVLAAPDGSLGAVRFEPTLPAIEGAIGKLAMGGVIKVIFGLDEPVWLSARFRARHGDERFDRMAFVQLLGATPFPTWWTPYPAQAPTLVGWYGGPSAFKLAAEGKDRIIQVAKRALATAMGMAPRTVNQHVREVVMHNWISDPWSRGTYSYVTVGGSSAAAVLARPIQGTLFFAGEHASSGRNGTVDGAIASGRRAAEQVLRKGGKGRG